jgi:hypothetical protein
MKINIKQFRDEYHTQSKRKLTNYAFDEAKKIVYDERDKLIKEFEEHNYSREIASAEHSSNSSKSLGGRGNLFSFIGFVQGETPVEWVILDLKENIGIRKFAEKISQRGNVITYTFPVNMPTIKELDERHPMPEWSSMGWLTAVRKGITGFRSYIYWKSFNPEVSRSTTGLQAKKGGKKGGSSSNLRSGDYIKPSRYLPEMLDDFKKKFK